MKKSFSDILFEEILGNHGNLGLITLNRPQVLNALNHDMFIALDKQLIDWQANKNIKAVIIRAAPGRAFCAGGDIRLVYERRLSKNLNLPHFFADEYRMNTRIHHFSKPYIALQDGITMGGGVGISVHGSHRVGTAQLLFAMPETGIGFYPDVGATYYLSRMPYKIGFYLGLTGTRIGYADCYATGIVQEIVERDSFPAIISALVDAKIPDKKSVTAILKTFATPVPRSELIQHQNEIATCFNHHTVEEILYALSNNSIEWCRQLAEVMKTKSPTSLKVTLKALQKAEKLSFDDCMQMEFRLTYHFLHGHDFFEGVRAVIIDKDQKPHWTPETLAAVTNEEVDKYFAPVTDEFLIAK